MARGVFKFSTAAVTLLAGLLAGCHPAPPPEPPPSTKPVELLKKPAIDLSRGGAGFPLAATTMPSNPWALRSALEKGYDRRLVDPTLTRVDLRPGFAPGAIERLAINLTGNTVRPDFVPQNPPKDAKPAGRLQVEQLEDLADPLKYATYAAGMRLMASDAELELIPDGHDEYLLNLVNCRDGQATFELSVDALQQSLANGVTIKRSPAFMIDSVDLSLSSANERSLAADVLVHAKVLFVPATFRLTGRLDVDADFNVHFLNLLATGTDPAGMLVAQLVQTKLDKVNGKAAPLLKFPGDQIKVDALQIHLSDILTVRVGLEGTR
ncbi:MAG: hypothetical protein ACTHM6_17505 [Tepidisphaeraceae bacterium]